MLNTVKPPRIRSPLNNPRPSLAGILRQLRQGVGCGRRVGIGDVCSRSSTDSGNIDQLCWKFPVLLSKQEFTFFLRPLDVFCKLPVPGSLLYKARRVMRLFTQ